jgi:hypothetical protein
MSQVKAPADLVSDEGFMDVSLLVVPHMADGASGQSGVSFLRTLISIIKTPPSLLNHLPKPHLQIPPH